MEYHNEYAREAQAKETRAAGSGMKWLAAEKYKLAVTAWLTAGVICGSLTCAVYGGQGMTGLAEAYCAGSVKELLWTLVPVTLGFVGLLLVCGLFRPLRWLIGPAAGLRGLGLGCLLCGSLQTGDAREWCFATLVLLPYALQSAVTLVWAGESAWGLREAFTRDNAGLSGVLARHALKMSLWYLTAAAFSCVLFAAACRGFARWLL